MDAAHRLRIGELSRRSGVSPALLRAWERRYGLLRPVRSSGGLRLYSLDDLRRVRTMQAQLAAGLAAAEAAAVAVAEPAPLEPHAERAGDAIRDELEAALLAFDEPRAHAVIDRLLARLSLDAVLTDVVVPYLHDLGERWQRGDVSVAQEHFATALLRGRLLGLGRGWGTGLGPTALLACPPGERHDLGLIVFALVLRARGWRIVYLGPDTPIASISEAALAAQPAVIVLGAVDRERFAAQRAELLELARAHVLALGGAGTAGLDLGEQVLVLPAGPVAAADSLTRREGAPV